ncbi:TIGR03621 family F420-dependent LLM class oxidoreductase [Microbacterium sp. B2969]|uniref:TIGR03621 family F420-dependent LLM class oxidoreductase n=1 Tax=Microbacterium alkaliflavum TaxID=3248839 RepID=A0ABW7Q8L5_9MICO
MRFGVVVGAPTRASHLTAVQRAEDLGYDVVLCSDHLELAGRHASWFTPIPALAAAATTTERVRLGTAVINQDLRHPAVLARDAASLDVLSDGRLELGLGAGWNEPEYDMAGLRFDPIGPRVRRFAEYVQVVKGVLAEPAFSFEGEFFRIRDMPGEPAPAQAPHPPIMIGGVGPRMLALAAREADIVSINMPKSPDPGEAALAERVAWVRESTPPGADRELQLPLAGVVPTARSAEEAVRAAAATGDQFLLSMLARRFGVEALADSPMVLAGSTAAMADSLSRLEESFGIGYVMIPMGQLEALAPVIEALR